jgi:hypothetical protein
VPSSLPIVKGEDGARATRARSISRVLRASRPVARSPVWRLLRWSQDLSSILACAYNRNQKHLNFLIENGEVRFSALTMRLQRVGSLGADLQHAGLIGGKGGTRTLDPGIMRPTRKIQCCNFNHLPRAPVATWHDEAQLSTTDSRKSPANTRAQTFAKSSVARTSSWVTRLKGAAARLKQPR